MSCDQLGQKTETNLDVFQCHDCGLVQAAMQLHHEYYDDYLMSQSHSAQLTHYLDQLVTRFLDQHAPSVTRVLDVGAGDGVFMLPFRKRGIAVEGIEPSERSRKLALDQGLTVYPGYLGPHTVLPNAPYDIFVSRQVLEHIDDISSLLQGLKNNLAPGARGIIEVPRLEKALEDNRFYDFFPDHVNYFSLETLETTMSLNGFRVLESFAAMHDEYNVVIVELRAAVDFCDLVNTRVSLVQQIDDLLQRPERTAVWGAGAKGLSILALIDSPRLCAVVDSDPNKIGKYTPISECLIQDPTHIIDRQIDVVIITAVAYQHMIVEKLHSMDYQGKIYLIGANGLMVYN